MVARAVPELILDRILDTEYPDFFLKVLDIGYRISIEYRISMDILNSLDIGF